MGKRDLTAAEVRALERPGVHRVSRHLYIQIRPGANGEPGTRSWLFRYHRGGKNQWLGLGPVADVTLSAARVQAGRLAALRYEGKDSLEVVKAERAALAEPEAESSAPTFRQVGAEYIAQHEASWRNEKHRAQWRSTLESYAHPIMGSMPVDQIEVRHVLEVLRPIWTTKAETASRLRGRIEAILDAATAQGLRAGPNPARWKGGLAHLLPPRHRARRVEHHAAVPYAEIPQLASELRARDNISAKALLFTLLTAARTGEAIGARWSEIDMKQAVWTVPAERMKGGRPHRVPLATTAVDLLNGLPRERDYVFPGTRPGRPLSNMALLEMMRALRGFGATTHGLRASFSTWAAECTDFPSEVIEAALAHVDRNVVRAAYARTDHFDARKALMVAWAGYAMGETAGRVVS